MYSVLNALSQNVFAFICVELFCLLAFVLFGFLWKTSDLISELQKYWRAQVFVLGNRQQGVNDS